MTFMLDQCHNIEEKIPGQIRSVLNVQEMTARALLVDAAGAGRASARRRRAEGAFGILMDAFYTDVRPSLATWRESRGLPADPMARVRRRAAKKTARRSSTERATAGAHAALAELGRVRGAHCGAHPRRGHAPSQAITILMRAASSIWPGACR